MRAPRRSALREERVDRFRTHRAIDQRRRRALAKQLVEKEARDRSGVRGVGELLLLDERVFLQPIQELRAVGADHACLRIMDMRIYEAGQNQLARVIVDPAFRPARARDTSPASPIATMRPSSISTAPSSMYRYAPRPGEPRRIPEASTGGREATRGAGQGRISAMSQRGDAVDLGAARSQSRSAASLSSRRSNAAKISALVLPLTAMMKGKPNLRAIGVVERR